MLKTGVCKSCEIISSEAFLKVHIETTPLNIEIGGCGGNAVTMQHSIRYLVAKLFPSTVVFGVLEFAAGESPVGHHVAKHRVA